MQSERTSYCAGMPQMAYTGLSENWLLKTCGDLHWQGLAQLAGQESPEFRDEHGNKAYAAFLAVRIRDAVLEDIGENMGFPVDSKLARAAAARHFSSHTLTTEAACSRGFAEVALLSTFIRRQHGRDNRSVVRAALPGFRSAPAPAAALELAALAKRFRSGDWGSHLGLEQAADRCAHVVEYLPCPYSDFNGADLLYFASFQSIVDRAEWQWRRCDEPPVISQRDLFFHGNVNVSGTLELAFSACSERADGLAHWCEIRRACDGEKIADVVTRKRWRMR